MFNDKLTNFTPKPPKNFRLRVSPLPNLTNKKKCLTLFSEGPAPFLIASFWSLFTVTKVNTVPHALQFGRVLN